MTRDEALYRVKGYLTDIIPVENYSEVEEIIKALKQEPCKDVISRQAAIETLNDNMELLRRVLDDTDVVNIERAKYEWGLGLIESCISNMKELPSAQPLTAYVISDEDGNIKCSNCGSSECWGNYCMNCGAKMRREMKTMDELISRQAAIDALNEYFARIGRLKRKGLTKGEKAISLDTVGTIKTLPSAQLRPKGNWIHSIYYGEIMPEHKCSECGTWEYSDEESNFCSYCGADMRGEDDE